MSKDQKLTKLQNVEIVDKSSFPNIVYNIKDSKYEQYSIMEWIRYHVFFFDMWFNSFELRLKKLSKKI